ncbi:hypothetical protein IFM89_024296 [Coptis chinensis]|uniref:RNase H type-1 domain-containing protein n=1 Tax=Coptis chinensis TaxID=261450 RepID=A0A835MJ23_9MAGN|nr:hypothetical protein IFM89_024296 [Coptis chinensis]
MKGISSVKSAYNEIQKKGNASLGASYRTSAGDFLLVIWRKIGVNTNYLAKVLAILEIIEIALWYEWKKIWVESDSSAAVVAFGSGALP